jgi:hypothetical protein
VNIAIISRLSKPRPGFRRSDSAPFRPEQERIDQLAAGRVFGAPLAARTILGNSGINFQVQHL